MSSVKSCVRTLQILELFSTQLRPLTLADIARQAAMPKSSCLAILETLLAGGYLYRVSDLPSYYPTRRWYEQSRRLLETDPVGEAIRQSLVRLRDACRETTINAVFSNGQSLYLDVVESRELIRFNAVIGDTKPVHASASGRAQLIHLPPAEREQALQGYRYSRTTDRMPTDRASLEAVLAREAQAGWSTNDGEYRQDVISIAAGYRLHEDTYSLVVAGPYQRVEPHAAFIGNLLKTEADALQQRLT